MKKALIVMILCACILPRLSNAQIAWNGLNSFNLGSTPIGGDVITVDTAYHPVSIPPSNVVTINYNPAAPYYQATITGDVTFLINGVPNGSSGKLRLFINGGTPHLNGVVNVSIPSAPATIVLTFTPVSGIINYN